MYRQLIVPCPNAVMEIEAKVRRYTGTRCICPAPSIETARTSSVGQCRHYCGRDWQVTDHFCLRLDHQARAGGKAGVAELAGCFFARGKHQSGGKGWTLKMSDRLSGRAWPFAPGFCQPWQVGCCLAKRAERGAERCHSILPKRGSLQRPVRKTHGRKWQWDQKIQSTHGQLLPRERIGARSAKRPGFLTGSEPDKRSPRFACSIKNPALACGQAGLKSDASCRGLRGQVPRTGR